MDILFVILCFILGQLKSLVAKKIFCLLLFTFSTSSNKRHSSDSSRISYNMKYCPVNKPNANLLTRSLSCNEFIHVLNAVLYVSATN